jgi:hypothetical protein
MAASPARFNSLNVIVPTPCLMPCQYQALHVVEVSPVVEPRLHLRDVLDHQYRAIPKAPDAVVADGLPAQVQGVGGGGLVSHSTFCAPPYFQPQWIVAALRTQAGRVTNYYYRNSHDAESAQ